MTAPVTLAAVEDVVHFEKGMTWTFGGGECVADPYCPAGTAYIVAVDRYLGTFTVSSEDPRSSTVTYMNSRDYEALRRQLAAKLPKVAGNLTPLQVGIAVTCTLAGLGWIIARRSALAGQQDSESWAKAVADWIVRLVRGLFGWDEEQA